jgi:hypothetical protein
VRSSYITDDDDVDPARLSLWTAATNGPIVHSPGDIWAWRNTVEWYRQSKTDSSTRALWQYCQHLPSSEVGGTRDGNDTFFLTTYLFILRKVQQHVVKPFDMGPTALLLRTKSCCGLSPLKIYRPRSGLNPQTLGPMASTLTTIPRTSNSYLCTVILHFNWIRQICVQWNWHVCVCVCVWVRVGSVKFGTVKQCLHNESLLARVKYRGCKRRRFMQVE